MWNLRPSFGAAHDEFLVITFISDTRVLQLSIDDELGEADLDCFDTEAQVNACTQKNVGKKDSIRTTSSWSSPLSATPACCSSALMTSWARPTWTVSILRHR